MFVVIEIYEDATPEQIAGMVCFVGSEFDRTNEPHGQNVNMRWSVLSQEDGESAGLDEERK